MRRLQLNGAGQSSDYSAGSKTGLLLIGGHGNIIETNIIQDSCSFDNVTTSGNYNKIYDIASDYIEVDMIRSVGDLQLRSDDNLNLRSTNPLFLQEGAWSDIYMFGNAGAGENRHLYIYGRDTGDSVTNYMNLRWGNGVVDDGLIETSSGNLTLNPNSNTVNIEDALSLNPIASPPGSPNEGDIYYDSNFNKLRLYDATGWVNLTVS